MTVCKAARMAVSLSSNLFLIAILMSAALPFRLFLDREIANTMSHDEMEYLYIPLVEPDRDQEMMELMPSYLTEEITFARVNASKFYSRVADTLTKKRVEE